MARISEYHYYLFFGKITNTLTAEESAELQVFFAANPEAIAEYEELLETLPSESVATSYNFLNQKDYWKELTAHKKKTHSSKIISLRKLSVAAIATGIIIISGILLFQSEKEKDPATTLLMPERKKEHIELKLANGKTINLSATKGQIKEGEITFENSAEILRYSSARDGNGGNNSIDVPTGMSYKIELSDGTLVWLNSTTRLEFPTIFSTSRREIFISGEAYLEVAKDPKKPFIVKLPSASVEVLGTRFNVNSYDKGIVKAALVEGKINLLTSVASAQLKPGIEGIFNEQSGKISQQAFDISNTLSWQKGLYFFEEATLNDLSKVLHRWFGVKTETDRAELKNKKFAGVLDKNKNINVFLRNLKIISGIESYFDKEGVLHFK